MTWIPEIWATSPKTIRWNSSRIELTSIINHRADHSGRAVYRMKFRRPLKHWDRGFESHSRYRYLSTFLLYLCCPAQIEGLRQGWFPVQLPVRFTVPGINSVVKRPRGANTKLRRIINHRERLKSVIT
jgi:hypothetical protein